MIGKLKIEKMDKKSLQYLGVIIIIAIIICIGFFYYLSLMPKIGMEDGISEKQKRERITKQQLKELEKEPMSLSGEEIKQQLKGLEELR